MNSRELQPLAREASGLLRTLGNEHRLLILCTLLDGERSVGDLVDKIGLSQSALSQHLARLRRDGLVRTRRSSQTIYYRVSGAEAPAVLATLHSLYCCKTSGDVAEFEKPIALAEASERIQRPAA
ncbi:MAG: winged helix-turn-helix transcriptional regulator [Rhizobiales bacterium]|nr:winged helix-turn-helix transcriptional regulator [Hyphomicrobiales bacterium]